MVERNATKKVSRGIWKVGARGRVEREFCIGQLAPTAQQIPPPSQPQGKYATVEVQVINAVTGSRVPNVSIALTPHFTATTNSSYTDTTNAEGKYLSKPLQSPRLPNRL
jgi:hypothetical protein